MIANKIFILIILLLFSSSNGYGQEKRDTSIDVNKGLVLNYSFLDLSPSIAKHINQLFCYTILYKQYYYPHSTYHKVEYKHKYLNI